MRKRQFRIRDGELGFVFERSLNIVDDVLQEELVRNEHAHTLVIQGVAGSGKTSKGKLEYADVFPLVYLKMRLEGLENPYREIKHLLIDEMQDDTPVQYAVLARLFTCRKTVLGDVAQSVNPYSASGIEDVRRALFGASLVKLTRSYRSTLQVMEFAQQISPHPDLVPMQRHGPPPRVIRCRTRPAEFDAIREEISAFQAAGQGSLGILCKTDRQARRLAQDLAEADIEHALCDEHSIACRRGVVVCSAHMAKGLEFDRVLVPCTGWS